MLRTGSLGTSAASSFNGVSDLRTFTCGRCVRAAASVIRFFARTRCALTLGMGFLEALLVQSPARGQEVRPAPRPYVTDSATDLLFHLDDEASQIARDASGKQRHGALEGELVDLERLGGSEHAHFDRALAVHGNGRVVWADAGEGAATFLLARAPGALTLEGWFARDDASCARQSDLFAVQPLDLVGVDYALGLEPAREQGCIFRLSLSDASGRVALSGPFSWPSGSWRHVALMLEQTTDGVYYGLYATAPFAREPALVGWGRLERLAAQDSDADRIVSFANRYPPREEVGLHGWVDELRVSRVARSVAELRGTTGPTTYDLIRTSATAENSDINHPMPLASSWDTGIMSSATQLRELGEGYTPDWQLQMIREGHFMLPAFWLPLRSVHPDRDDDRDRFRSYYARAIAECARRELPLSFPGTQWEQGLASDNEYTDLPPNQSPNVLTRVGAAVRALGMLSPFGSLAPWSAIGRRWGESEGLRKLQEWYPSPPKIVFLSNNEASRLTWTNADRDENYRRLFATRRATTPDENKLRELFGNGWIERYRALQAAWRKALRDSPWPAWADRSIFVGYNAFGQSNMGRWDGWRSYGLETQQRADPSPSMWEGAMISGYLMPGIAKPVGRSHYPTDYWVFSPQVGFMNDEYHRRLALRDNPSFWVELGVWNGDDEYPPKEEKLASFDPPYSAERYGGMVQFGMWMLRPRVVRDFRARGRKFTQPYYEQVIAAVDRVYSQPVLGAFWRRSELISNEDQPNPYAASLSRSARAATRMFMLEVEQNPKPPWTAFTEISVYALARVQGEAPARKWLLFAFAPRVDRRGITARVRLPIPDGSDPRRRVTVSVPATAGGSYSVIDETPTGLVVRPLRGGGL
jgi:hypothetical protein